MIAEHNVPRLMRLLPVAVVATLMVAGVPMLVVSVVRVTGLVRSTALAMALGLILSVAGSYLGGLWWERRSRSRDVLFGDLMIWGWVRRYRIERRLASAVELLEDRDRRWAPGREPVLSAEGFSAERRARALEQLAASLEARDPYTHGHSQRVARYSTMIAKRMRVSKQDVARIRAAAAMHDVGKIETPIAVLHKPDRLTDEEFDAIKRHPVDGAQMVAPIGDDALTAIVRHHHERLDGTGYPDGLAGVAIPLGARIVAVADTFDAITSERPYRPANPHKRAIEILRREAGQQLDPDSVDAFCSLYFGRRPLGIWIAVTNAFARLASWLVAETAGSTARVAALAASTAALGVGAVALPAAATWRHSLPARLRAAGATASRAGAARTLELVASQGAAAGAEAHVSHRGVGRSVPPGRLRAPAPSGTAPPAPVNARAGAGVPPGNGGSSAGTAPTAVAGGPATSGAGVTASSGQGSGGSGSAGVTAGATAGSQRAGVSAGVTAGSQTVGVSVGAQGSGLPSVGVKIGG